MKNAIAHPRNVALNSNVIATCKDKISQGKTNSNDSSVETLMTYSYDSEKGSIDNYIGLECDAKSFNSAQRNALLFSRIQSNVTSGTTSFQRDAIHFGSTQCDTTPFDSTQCDVSLLGSTQRDATFSLGDCLTFSLQEG